MATDGFHFHRRFATLAAIVTMAFRILSLLLCLLVAGPMSTPVWALARPENRAGKIFSSPLKSTSADLDQTLDPRRENPACGYDFASGVCKYLYAHANPVNGTDPSGHEFNLVGMMSGLGISDILQTAKGVRDTAIQVELRGLNRDLLNDLNPRDLPRNHRTGLEGEVVWTRYLNTIGFKAVQASQNLGANGPDVFAAGMRNGRYHIIIGEVKASKSYVPGVAALKWNIMNGARQMSYSWLDGYGSEILEGLVKLGLNSIGAGDVQMLLDRGQLEVYLLGAHKVNRNKWKIRGFRLLHAGADEVIGGDGGMPEIVNEREVNAVWSD